MKKKIPMILACSLLLALAGCSAGGADSRAEAEKYFDAERVFVNGRLCARPSRELNEGDSVTVRGKGRFIFAEILGESRKGRLRVRVERDAGT